jgi:hypothetical protein
MSCTSDLMAPGNNVSDSDLMRSARTRYLSLGIYLVGPATTNRRDRTTSMSDESTDHDCPEGGRV